MACSAQSLSCVLNIDGGKLSKLHGREQAANTPGPLNLSKMTTLESCL
jgi:hypothetical protein